MQDVVFSIGPTEDAIVSLQAATKNVDCGSLLWAGRSRQFDNSLGRVTGQNTNLQSNQCGIPSAMPNTDASTASVNTALGYHHYPSEVLQTEHFDKLQARERSDIVWERCNCVCSNLVISNLYHWYIHTTIAAQTMVC